ncbi:hypothetical protein GTA08_BOTSDO00620 [Neofusicoccum parvum]|nr:hypothetical protein GTA08_BOTSDO00620 [Neofusicoccum parvum]
MGSNGPLSEISPMEHRRNSPSAKLSTKPATGARETSPLDTSPFGSTSKHRFWQSRDPSSPDIENSFEREQQTLSPKRSSIENLMKASRVRNSTMFAREQKQEYDPTKLPVVERPLAGNRPLSAQGFTPRGFDPLRPRESPLKNQQQPYSDSQDTTPRASPSKFDGGYTTNSSPSKTQSSPLRSSLSRNGRYSQGGYDNDSSVLSSDDERVGEGPQRPLRRHAKSVTFEAKPPIINEYEMVTPEPSLASRDGSYDSGEDEDEEDYEFEGDSMERDDSFDASLEDTEKTPVVLPGDWRHMSPEAANTSLADTFDDPFDGRESSPPPSARPNSSRPEHARNHSNASDSEQRPLPPLPPAQGSPDLRGRRESSNGLSAAAERASSAHRSLPSPPRLGSTISKSDILSIGRNSMSLEDRLQLMGIQGSREATPTLNDKEDSSKEEEPEKKDSQDTLKIEQPAETDVSALDEMNIPHISRESILEKVKSRNYDDYDFADQPSVISERDYGDLEVYDPDVPIPSREVSSNFDEDVPDEPFKTKREDEDVTLDFNSIPEFRSAQASPDRDDDSSCEGSVIHHDISGTEVDDDDDASHYSSPHSEPEEKQVQNNSTDEDDGPPTPKAEEVEVNDDGEMAPKKSHHKVASLPEFGQFTNEEDFHLQLQSYLGKNRGTPVDSAPKLEPNEEFLQRPITPADELEGPKAPGMEEDDVPGTPDSVIRHPIEPPAREDSSEVEDPVATIKAPGGSLKTRSSATPSDFNTMAATRRKVSGEAPPSIPERSPNRLSMTAEDLEEPSHLSHVSEEQELSTDDETKSEGDEPKRRQSFKMKLDFPVGDIGEDLSFDLDREFDRVLEAQKKGYLMRQNTKVVVASSRKFSDETTTAPTSGDSLAPPPTNDRGVVPAPGNRSGSGSGKKGRDRSNTWTTEPWNGKTRRRSIRNASNASVTVSETTRPRTAPGIAPPLPGQESAVTDNFGGDMSMIDEGDENMERGRLFVKVVGVKDLDLPLPKNERTWFQLTLDNGLHCVTTAWLDLARNAPIGQEFELVVLNDLEFQLTLQTKLTPPPKPKVTAPAPAPAKPAGGHKKSNSAFGRLLTSPKKRKEQERKQQEEAERAERAAAMKAQEEREAAKRAKANPTAWDLLHDLVAPDGSFARAYVCLKNHERQAYGRPFTVDVPCFNEWALEDSEIASSVKSKRGGPVRRPPYKVGKLTLQLLYVPKPKGATDDDMPKSMNACVRELKEAEESKGRVWEGHLSQQGGDCPYWRRRFFRLSGTKLTAYHETTRQPRATINLAKAAKLIDDRTALVHNRPGGRRKSGFAEEDEGYAFVEEGFRIRFGNGETIDFYADSAEQKNGWMDVLYEVVGKDAMSSSAKAWTELVFQKEKAERAALRAQGQQPGTSQSQQQNSQQPSFDPTRPGMYDRGTTNSAPDSAAKRYHRRSEVPPPPVEKSPRHHAIATGPRTSSRRGEVKSMIF